MSVIWKGFSAFQIVQLVLYLWHGGSIMPGPFGEICTGCLSQSELSLKLHSLSSSLFINWHHNTFPTCFLRSRSQISLYGLKLIPFSWKFRKTKSKRGEQNISFAGPKIWNDLPLGIRSCFTVDSFKKKLKTHLFSFWPDPRNFESKSTYFFLC